MLNLARKPWPLVGMLLVLGCGKAGESGGPTSATPGGGAGAGAGAGGIAGNGPGSGTGPIGLPAVTGQPDTSVKTSLPPIPSLGRVTASSVGDSVAISVEPFAGALDYRVYVLPADGDVTANADGTISVANAIYRCSGDRQATDATVDNAPLKQSQAVSTQVDDVTVRGFKRKLADAALGYVYFVAGPGRVPVYALGDPSEHGDNLCFAQRWNESRVKKYTTSDTERAQLIKSGWRDDGIVFYAPSAGPRTVYLSSADDQLYFIDGPEKAAREKPQPVFTVLDAVDGAESAPLMRVYYKNSCATNHDELVVGEERFRRARYQGDKLPLFDLHWPGITGDTTLVVEALDKGCPYPGVLASASRDASKEDDIDYPPFLTVADAQAASPTGEVFVNGQHDPKNKPKPIARSFVKVSPSEIPAMDWFAGFGPDENVPDFNAGNWNDPCELPDNDQCFKEYRQKSDFADLSFNSSTFSRDTVGVVQGELVVTYADVGADVGGHFRMTPLPKAKMSADDYLHVTMEVDAYATSRRYPQIIISDGEAPVQAHFAKSNSIVFQPFPDHGSVNWPFVNVVEVCAQRPWEVNNQCPHVFLGLRKSGSTTTLLPIPEVSEHSGVDRSTRFDLFASTKRIYVFTDGLASGCVDLPSTGIPSGDVTVTFGDALYHSGVDEVHTFFKTYQLTHAHRHFDNLGFKSAAPEPRWDGVALPCVSFTAQVE